MAYIDLPMSSSNGTASSSMQKNSRVRLYYTSGGGSITVTSCAGYRTDGYRTWGQATSNKIRITINGDSRNLDCSMIDFGASSTVKDWTDFPDQTWSGLGGTYTVSVYVISCNNTDTIQGCTWSGSIDAGYTTYSVQLYIANMDCYGNYGSPWLWINTTTTRGNSIYYTGYESDSVYNPISYSNSNVQGNISTTVYASRKKYDFNLNILDPNGTEQYSTGSAGSIEFSTDGGSSYTRVINEPESSYYVERPFALRNFQPGTGMKFSNINGNTSGTYSVSQPASALAITVYTSWITYKIAYDTNGGSGAPSTQTKTYSNNLTLSSTKPTRSGYDFLGWSTSSSATSATYSAGATLSSDLSTTDGATITLYAVWRETKPSNLSINGTVNGPFEISLKWSATGVNCTYKVYANGQQIYSGSGTSYTYACAEESTYNIYFTAINKGGTTTSSTISLTTPADQAKIRIKKDGAWVKGKTYFKKDGTWVKAKKIYIKVDGKWKINNNYDS